MICSKTTSITCLLLMLAGTVHAQFCSTQEGTVLYYKVTDTQQHKSYIDSVWIDKVVRDGDKLIVEEVNYDEKLNTFDDSVSITKVVYDGKNVTTRAEMSFQEGYYEKIYMRAALAQCKEEERANMERRLKAKEKPFSEKGSIILPLKADAKAGERIPDCEHSFKLSFIKSYMRLTEGKYEGFEEVQTQAGTFRCLKVSYRLTGKFAFTSQKAYITEWYAQGIGVVKGEERDSKGKLQASVVLQRIATR